MRYVTHSDRTFGMSAEHEPEGRKVCMDAALLMDAIIGLREAQTKAWYGTPKDSPGVQRIETAVNHLTLWLYGRLAFTGLFLRTGRKAFRVLTGRGNPTPPGHEEPDTNPK